MKNNLKISSVKQAITTSSVVVLLLLLRTYNATAQNSISSQQTTKEKITANHDRTVSGIVLGDDGQALMGVDVILQGSKTGTITNAEGEFTFPKLLKKGDVLLFHYLGFKSAKHVVDEDELNVINLEIDIIENPEVVVYGDAAVKINFKSKRSHWKKKKGKE